MTLFLQTGPNGYGRLLCDSESNSKRGEYLGDAVFEFAVLGYVCVQWIQSRQDDKINVLQCNILTDDGLAMEGPEFRSLPEQEAKKILPKLQVSACVYVASN